MHCLLCSLLLHAAFVTRAQMVADQWCPQAVERFNHGLAHDPCQLLLL